MRRSNVKNSFINYVQPLCKEFKDTISYRDFGCNIKYECTLYYNNEKVSEANGEVRSTRDLYSMQNIEEVFRNAVKLSCENIARQISERK